MSQGAYFGLGKSTQAVPAGVTRRGLYGPGRGAAEGQVAPPFFAWVREVGPVVGAAGFFAAKSGLGDEAGAGEEVGELLGRAVSDGRDGGRPGGEDGGCSAQGRSITDDADSFPHECLQRLPG